jgi:hypothetical protein
VTYGTGNVHDLNDDVKRSGAFSGESLHGDRVDAEAEVEAEANEEEEGSASTRQIADTFRGRAGGLLAASAEDDIDQAILSLEIALEEWERDDVAVDSAD